ncbi:hypothetical protein [Psychroflexus planctonicus]|uniref:Uncharacterized protein n=1 Tax=Psychroflexus planctonicus TaxID=1526575 RepID=A0ABQ1SIP6_9FLAO|nr:hypothetical protein [Psychroflexus planctonicus]GGE36113.1 hypothetical protein GCM10010832_15380 [Psychroflexus planctonicus]
MKAKKHTTNQAFFFGFVDAPNQNHPLYILTKKIYWDLFEVSFSSKYSKIMEISKANYWMKLSKARKDLYHFMQNKCRFANKLNLPSRCQKS